MYGHQWTPTFSKTANFWKGNDENDKAPKQNVDWPKPADMENWPLEDKMKLSKIHYKNAHGWMSLSSLKFEFSNGIKSPGSETQEARHQGWRCLDID